MRKYTIRDFDKDFPDDDACLEWLVDFLNPDGVPCRKCLKETKHHKVTGRPAFVCDHCGSHVYPMADTIFEKSPTPLRLWFYAIFLMASTRCGISAKQVQRETGVTYKTAWRMCHIIRSMLEQDHGGMSGEVEVDETYVGGIRRGKRGRGAAGKHMVFGLAQRQGPVTAVHTDNAKRTTIFPIVDCCIEKGSTVYTDEFPAYLTVSKMGYKHSRVNHKAKQYVIGKAHTNTIEGFWSVLKRGVDGVYHHVSGKYLQRYVDEYAFRYNHREEDTPMFWLFLSRVLLCGERPCVVPRRSRVY